MNNKAIFLDRDGVLNRAIIKNYKPFSPMKYDDFYIFKYNYLTLKKLKRNGFFLIVVTNQPEIARGNLKITELNKMHNSLLKNLGIDKIYYCPHDNRDNCICRKPNIGLIEKGINEFKIDIRKSFLIGDRKSDIEAGNKLKLKCFYIDRNYKEEKPNTYYKKIKNLNEILNYI